MGQAEQRNKSVAVIINIILISINMKINNINI